MTRLSAVLAAVLVLLTACTTVSSDNTLSSGAPTMKSDTAQPRSSSSASSSTSDAAPPDPVRSGTAGSEPADPGPTDGLPPAGVSVEVRQGRTDIAAGVMVIRVVNDRDEPVEVVSATYTDNRFAEPAAWTGDSTVPAHNARDLRVPIPSAACTDQDPLPAAVLQLAGQDPTPVPVVDPFDFVATTTAADCLARELGAAVTLDVAAVRFTGVGAAEQAVIELRATPVGAAPVRLDLVDGTILLKPVGEGTAWVLDTEVAAPATVELVAEPNRCDPHAVADDKVGTRFRVTVTLDSGLTGQLVVPADDEQRTALYAYLARRCA